MLCCADVANLISKTLEVDSSILTAVMFTQYGMTIAWRLQGSTANELSYTVRMSCLAMLRGQGPLFCWVVGWVWV